MYRNILLFIILFTQSANPVNAHSLINYSSIGDTLYSWAEGGLNIRSSGNKNAAIIGTVPYGGVMSFVEYDSNRDVDQILFYKSTDADTLINGIPLHCVDYFQKGLWIKIQYRDLTGYVFNGYTSRYKPSEEVTWIKLWMEKSFQLLFQDEAYDEEDDTSSKYLYFEKGISITAHLSKAGGWIYFFPNMSLEEAILLCRKNIEAHYKEAKPDANPCPTEIVTDKDAGLISLYFTNHTNWSLRITCIGGTVVITESVWC